MTSFIVALLVNSVAFLAVMWLYISALRWIRSRLDGWARHSVGLFCYVCMAIMIGYSLGHLIRSEVAWWIAMIGWLVSVMPGLFLWVQRRVDLTGI